MAKKIGRKKSAPDGLAPSEKSTSILSNMCRGTTALWRSFSWAGPRIHRIPFSFPRFRRQIGTLRWVITGGRFVPGEWRFREGKRVLEILGLRVLFEFLAGHGIAIAAKRLASRVKINYSRSPSIIHIDCTLEWRSWGLMDPCIKKIKRD